ncbi:BTAD domain-containing putative transcriptional regulator [Antrihabitans sp. YC2-6]|uniref:BTAD domain-containing putative transcriptional regulator n=1 Tax=Antrihabitans sp. YC2-6 TaxID=2799498 RepID=UPI0018F2C95D|nr:BTAD domain-containing putative transcriptional regulator [Antrihabitans sp. YC2-6]MBJ8346428.1 winged helix-turn-helix domain-containing protein [Antrihabitans sp. YC2-6]
MRFGILGPLAVWTDTGEPVAVPGTKVRALLADLLVNVGRPVSADRLIDDIWGERPPGNAAGTLSAKASQLRRALEDAEPGAKSLVVSPPPGYRLHTAEDAVDAARFRQLLVDARGAEPDRTVALLTEALALWRGPALAEFADDEFAVATIAKLQEQRLVAWEDLAHARLNLGQHTEVVGDISEVLAENPLRERLRAAHMRALYGAGRQHEALASYDELRALLADELGLDPSAELVALQRAILAQDESLSAPPPQMIHVKRRSTNLPADLTALVGRDDALRDLDIALGDERLVTLTGPGGVGKTRLAVAAAGATAARHADGVWLVELAGLERPTPADLAEHIAETLEIRDTGEIPNPIERLLAAVRSRATLLVLDNCEHVVDAVAELAEHLLRSAPGARVLATSREPLGLPGECVWTVDTLEQSSAIELFVARARSSDRDFVLDDASRDAIALLCRRLDGIPLALELAATRVRGLGVHEMVARLDDRFRLLATGHRGRPPRQQTLQAMIDWSWDLLSSDEQTVLRRLAVHADGCTLDAAETICSGTDLPEYLVPELLVRLVDRSLVVSSHTRGETRYRLLESVAAYCLRRQHEAEEVEALRARHLAYYRNVAESAAPLLYHAEQQRSLHRLDAETANIRLAFDHAIASRHADDALAIANSLAWYWFLRGRLGEGRRCLRAALETTGGAAELRAIASAWDAGFAAKQGAPVPAPKFDDITDPRVRARAEWFAVFTAIDAPGPADLDSTLATFEQVGDEWGIAAVHLMKAMAAHVQADIAELGRCAERSAELFARVGDRWGQLQAAEWLGALAELRGDFDGAAEKHRAGLRIAEELELWQDVAGHLSWLGWIAMEQSKFEQAIEYCEPALKLAAEQGSMGGQVFASMGLGFAARRGGQVERALEVLRGIIDITPEGPPEEAPPYLPTVLCELGFIAEIDGDATHAWDCHSRAYSMSVVIQAPRDAAWALEGMAGALALRGRAESAAQLLGAAEAIQTRVGMPPSPSELTDVARIVEVLSSALNSAQLEAERATGRGLSDDELATLVAMEAATHRE